MQVPSWGNNFDFYRVGDRDKRRAGMKRTAKCKAFSSAWKSIATRLNQSAADRKLAA